MRNWLDHSSVRFVRRYVLPLLLAFPVCSVIAVGLATGNHERHSASSAMSAPVSGGHPNAMVTRALSPQPRWASGLQTVAFNNSPAAAQTPGQVVFFSLAPDIYAGSTPPHGERGPCQSCHKIVPHPAQLQAVYGPATSGITGTPAVNIAATRGSIAPVIQAVPFQQAYWQGLEVAPLSHSLATALGVPDRAQGVVIREVTQPADAEGFLSGDLITAINNQPTPDLERFVSASMTAHSASQVQIEMLRSGQPRTLTLSALRGSLGTASGKTTPMIQQNSRPPHGDRGGCPSCHVVVPAR